MRKVVWGLLWIASTLSLSSLEVNENDLKESVKLNPEDIKNRLALSRYYMEHNESIKSLSLIKKVLQIDPKNETAKKLYEKARVDVLIEEAIEGKRDINEYIQQLYEKEQYKKIISLYLHFKNTDTISKIGLSVKSLINIARVAMWDGKYKLSLEVLNRVEKDNLDAYEIKAEDCKELGDSACAIKILKKLYFTTGECRYATKIMKIYLEDGRLYDTKRFLKYLKKRGKICKGSGAITKKLQKKLKQNLKKLEEIYRKEPSYRNLEPLAFALYEENPPKALDIVRKYTLSHPEDREGRLLGAKLLAWMGKYDESIKMIDSIDDLHFSDARLFKAKVFAWKGEYKRALDIIDKIQGSDKTKKRYEALKLKANIYLWSGNKDMARELFEKLEKVMKDDQEIKESLLLLRGKTDELIRKYEKRLQEDPQNSEIRSRLAELYSAAGEKKKALSIYEKMIEENPHNIDTYKSAGDLYLETKNLYKGFGDWEYYGNFLSSRKSLYELAQRYIWYGYEDAAVSVLDDLLRLYPDDRKAMVLKAKALKSRPRYLNLVRHKNKEDEGGGGGKKADRRLLEMADRAYKGGLFKTAADYYWSYIQEEPEDYSARERYAMALEKSGRYKEAAGEFYLMQWMVDDENIIYHYAYNLQKSNEPQRAQKVYRKLLKRLPKDPPVLLKSFLKRWKNAQEKLDARAYVSLYDVNDSQMSDMLLKVENLFRKSDFISIGIYDSTLLKQENDRYRLGFYETYASKIEKRNGYVELVVECTDDSCLIESESFKESKYIPSRNSDPLGKEIAQRLEELQAEKTQNLFLKKREGNNRVHRRNRHRKLNGDSVSGKLEAPSEKEDDRRRISIDLDTNYFRDNAGISMYDSSFSLSNEVGDDMWLSLLGGAYRVDDDHAKYRGGFYGLGAKYKGLSAKVVENYLEGKGKLGWSLGYETTLFGDSITLSLERSNLLYYKRTSCSAKHMQTRARISGYHYIAEHKGLWWSLAFEDIDDGNRVLTLQYDYEFYNIQKWNSDFVFVVYGWYQLNSLSTDCYYSPKKVDNTLFAIRLGKPFTKNWNLEGEVSLGYSLEDQSVLYNGGLWLKSSKNAGFESKIGCEMDNGTGAGGSGSGYRSLNCSITFRKYL